MQKKILKTGAAVFVGMLAFTGSAFAADVIINEPDMPHSYQTLSSLGGIFHPISCGAVKAAWGSPSQLPGENYETWTKSGDFLYNYWFHVVDKDGNMIFGGSPIDEDERGTITAEQADAAFRSHMNNFNWKQVGLSWAYVESPISSNVSSVDTETVNGWEMTVYEGMLSQKDTSVPFVAYMVVYGDNASWCVVVADKEDAKVSDVRDAALSVAKSYRDGKTYVRQTGMPFLY